MLLAAAYTLAPQQAVAQSSQEPAVVISIASIDEQLNDLDYLANAAGEQIGQMSGFLKMQATAFVKGVDLSKPAGAMLYFQDGAEEPTPVLFVPVKIFDDLLDTINNWAEVEEGDGELFTIVPDGGEDLLLKKLGDYAVISNNEKMIDAAPGNPEKLLSKMASKYNLAAQIFAQRIPADMRQQAMDLIRSGAEGSLENMPELDPMQAELQRKNIELQMAQMESFINDTEELTIGLVANQDEKAIQVDVKMTGSSGSELAQKMEASANVEPTQFSGFLMDDAAFNMNLTSQLVESDAENFKKLIAGLKDGAYEELESNEEMNDDQVDMLKNMFGQFIEVMNETLDKGRMDMAAVMTADKGDMNLAMGAFVVDPKKLENIVKEIVKAAQEDPEFKEKFRFTENSSSAGSVVFHEAIVQVPEDEEEMQDVLGEQIKVVIGVGKNEIYMGMGKDPESLLRKAIAGKKETEYSMQFNMFMGRIMRFASGIEGAEMMDTFADALEEGSDRIQVTSKPIENGFAFQFEIQDGILKLLGVAGQAMGEFGQGGADF